MEVSPYQVETTRPPKTGSRATLWVSTTYFAEGFPYSVVNNLAEILFKELGASLQVIGLTSLFHLPWNVKFLWGPLVDQFETKRRWLIGVEAALAIGLIGLSLVASSAQLLGITAAFFMVLAILSATQDIAIDGFYLEGLDKKGQSRFVGFRAMAYKVASLVVRGPLIILIGWIGWRGGLLAAAGVMVALTLIHFLILPRVETRKRPATRLVKALLGPKVLALAALIALAIVLHREVNLFGPLQTWGKGVAQKVPAVSNIPAAGWIALGLLAFLLVGIKLLPRLRRMAGSDSYYTSAFVDFLSRKHVARILAFVVLFRTGESFLQKMKWPFLRDDLGMSLEQYGFASGTLGVLASFTATFVGGWLISRQGLRRWIWPFVLGQNVLNLLYWALATWGGPHMGLGVLTAVITFENFGEGLGTAVFMVYLMRCCDPAHKAAHMAILTALMSVSFTVAGVASGFLADWIGFAHYFGFTFLATWPGMLLIFFVPYLDD